MSLFKLDGVEYDGVVQVIRKARILKNNLGQTLDGKQHYQALGTYYDYEVTLNTKKMNISAYDSFYESLTAPVNEHTVTLPYGQGDITFAASVSIGSDSIVQNFSSFRRWSSLKVTIESLEPQRLA